MKYRIDPITASLAALVFVTGCGSSGDSGKAAEADSLEPVSADSALSGDLGGAPQDALGGGVVERRDAGVDAHLAGDLGRAKRDDGISGERTGGPDGEEIAVRGDGAGAAEDGGSPPVVDGASRVDVGWMEDARCRRPT